MHLRREALQALQAGRGHANVLPDGRILYWDALEGTENNRFSIVAEGGTTFTNDQTRLLDLEDRHGRAARRTRSTGGANPDGARQAAERPADPRAAVQRDLQRRRAVRLTPDLPRRWADPRAGRHRLLGRPRRPRHALRRRRARRPQGDAASSTRRRTTSRRSPTRRTGAGTRRSCRSPTARAGRRRRAQAHQARVPRQPRGLTAQRRADRDLRPEDGQLDGQRHERRALAAAVPAAAPAARRQGLLQHGRAVVQPGRPGLRPGELERRRGLRPDHQELAGPRDPRPQRRHAPRTPTPWRRSNTRSPIWKASVSPASVRTRRFPASEGRPSRS